MSTGTIERLVRDRGFGFIKVASGIALFFHCNDVQDALFDLLKKGQKVAFEARLTSVGLKASNVKLLNNKAQTGSQNENNNVIRLESR